MHIDRRQCIRGSGGPCLCLPLLHSLRLWALVLCLAIMSMQVLTAATQADTLGPTLDSWGATWMADADGTIRSIDFNGLKLNIVDDKHALLDADAVSTLLAQCQGLHDLSFHRVRLDGAHCAFLAEMPVLQSLTADHSIWDFDHRAFVHLADHPTIRELRIGASGVDTQSMAIIAGLPQLETLNLGYCHNLRPGDFAPLANANGLRRLMISFVQDTDLAFLDGCLHLESLTIIHSILDTQALTRIAALKTLRELRIGMVLDADIDPLLNMTWLESLTLNRCCLSSVSRERLAAALVDTQVHFPRACTSDEELTQHIRGYAIKMREYKQQYPEDPAYMAAIEAILAEHPAQAE